MRLVSLQHSCDIWIPQTDHEAFYNVKMTLTLMRLRIMCLVRRLLLKSKRWRLTGYQLAPVSTFRETRDWLAKTSLGRAYCAISRKHEATYRRTSRHSHRCNLES